MVAVTLLAITALALSHAIPQPHLHHQHHVEKREAAPEADPNVVIQYVTVTASVGAASTTATSSTTSAAAGSSTSAAAAVPTSSAAAAAAGSAASSAPAAASSSSAAASGSSGFVDNTIPCSQFPSNVPGIVALDYLGWGGWSGIQSGDAAGSSCTEGSYCSYACAPGMAKTQWPANQPSDGQSRGGLLCVNGLLQRTRTDVTDLCEAQANTAYVQNDVGQEVVICQTDYPGSENMVIPTSVGGTNTSSLITCINSASYFQWDGKPTSSQFYVQQAGVSQETGCQWGSAGSNIGNFSPLNIGAGMTNGLTYLSLIPNPNGEISALNYNVEIVANSGGSINGACSIINGVFSGGANGCTVTVTSGTASFRFF